MQATQTTRRFDSGQIKRLVIAAGLLVSLAIGAAALAVADQFPTFGGSETRAVQPPQISSDELYALEANEAIRQAAARHAAMPQMTSDEAYALEASLVATAATYQHNQMMQLTPDEAWAIEQAQLLSGPSGDGAGK